MRKVAWIPALLLVALPGVSTPVYAQEAHIVGGSELHEAVVGRAATEETQREAIRSLLRRSEVREIAGNAGLDIEKAEGAVAMLQGPELARLAAQARQANTRLIGGQDRIVIGTTTLIIILLILIILILL